MHSRSVSEQWQELPSRAAAPTWRLVDALISMRMLFAKVAPDASGASFRWPPVWCWSVACRRAAVLRGAACTPTTVFSP